MRTAPFDVTGIKQQFYAFAPKFTGGVNITTGDLNGDGKAELIVAAGPGGGPEVKIYSPNAQGLLVEVDQFYAYAPTFHGGVSVGSNQGYDTQVQVRQVLNAQLPANFVETPYPPGSTVPGAANGYPLISSVALPGTDGNAPIPAGGVDFDTGQVVPAGNAGTLDTNNIPLPYVTVGSGGLQYLSGDLLNSYGQVAYRPNIFVPPDVTNTANAGNIVFANWADTTAASNYPTDGSNPPTAVPVGPYIQVGETAAGTPVITRLTAPPGQGTTRDQLITGAGPGGGPHVIVWGFNGTGSKLQQFIGQQFFAFSPSYTGGVNVAIGDVISDPFPEGTTVLPGRFTNGNPLDPFLDETTANSGTIASPTWPFDPQLLRKFTPEIIVTQASGGSLARIYADNNPLVADPNNPLSGPAPSVRTSLSQLDLVPALIATAVVADPTNPLGGYANITTTDNFDHAIDPEFAGGLNTTVSAFTFDGSANDILVGVNPVGGTAGFNTNPVLGQTVFSAGSAAASPNRGSTVTIFNQMSTLTQTSAHFTGPRINSRRSTAIPAWVPRRHTASAAS